MFYRSVKESSCSISSIIFEISCPASLAKILAKTNIFRKIKKIVFNVLSMQDLVIFNVPDERVISIPNQVRILHGSHVDF